MNDLDFLTKTTTYIKDNPALTDSANQVAHEALNNLRFLEQEIGEQPWLTQQIETLHALVYNPAGVTKSGKPARMR